MDEVTSIGACVLVLSGVVMGYFGLRRQSKWYYLGLLALLLPTGYVGYGLYRQYKQLRASGATVSVGPGLKINVTFPTVNLNAVKFDGLKSAADAGTLRAEEIVAFIKNNARMASERPRLAEQLVNEPWVTGKAADVVVDGLIQSWPVWMPERNVMIGTLEAVFASSGVELQTKERLMMFVAEKSESEEAIPRRWLEDIDKWSMVLPISEEARKKGAASQARQFGFVFGDGKPVRAGSVVPFRVGAASEEQNMRIATGNPPFRFSASMKPGDVAVTAPLMNQKLYGMSALTWQSNVIAPQKPGKYKVEAVIEVARDRDDVYQYYWLNSTNRPAGLRIEALEPVIATRILTGELEVIATETVMDRCTHPDDTKRMAAAIEQSGQSRAYLTKNGVEVQIELSVKPDACSLVCDVILIEGGQEFMLGTYAAVQGEETIWSMSRDGIVNAEGRSFLKFVPRPELIPYSPRATRIYAGEPIQKEILLILYGSR